MKLIVISTGGGEGSTMENQDSFETILRMILNKHPSEYGRKPHSAEDMLRSSALVPRFPGQTLGDKSKFLCFISFGL